MSYINNEEYSQNYLAKVRRKQTKCQHKITDETGLQFKDSPTCNLVICNAGLSSGLTIETLINEFAKYGTIKNVHMIPGKSYCSVIYGSSTDAEKAYVACNGKLKIAQDGKPIFLGYAIKQFNTNMLFEFQKPPGLTIVEDVVTLEDEENLMKLMHGHNETNLLKHRYVKHYGYEFKYDTNNVDREDPLLETIPQQCHKYYDVMGFIPDQLTVNCYQPGHGIPPHVDTHSAFEDPIASLSLGSDIVMEFRHQSGKHYSVLLPRRSVTILRGPSRFDWSHAITPRKYDIIETDMGLSLIKRSQRISFTFRKVNMSGICKCNFPSHCDTQTKKLIKDTDAKKLEDTYVQEVYNTIAPHFSDTRHKPWPNVLEFINSFELGSIVLDIGCGNGKNMGHNMRSLEIGCDNSNSLLNLCKQRNLEVLTCNCITVPFKDSVADGIISIAVIHHLASDSRRRKAIEEIVRLLHINGKALVYVWAKDQSVKDKSSYLKQDRKNRKSTSCIEDTTKLINVGSNMSLPVHTNRKQFAEQDMLVPWKLKDVNESTNTAKEFLRFYHVFEENELKHLVESFENVKILNYYYDQGNWCVIFEKIM